MRVSYWRVVIHYVWFGLCSRRSRGLDERYLVRTRKLCTSIKIESLPGNGCQCRCIVMGQSWDNQLFAFSSLFPLLFLCILIHDLFIAFI